MKTIKNITLITLVLLLTLTLTSCGFIKMIGQLGKPKLLLYNWGEYINPEVVLAFEEEYNVAVREIPFTSNEQAINMLGSGKYDLAVPSDYGVEQLIQNNLIQKIDWNKLTEMKKTDLSPILLDMFAQHKESTGFDMLEYAIPYFWGNFGLLYNIETVDVEDLKAGWGVLKNPKYKVALYDSSRDGLLVASKDLGHSINDEDPKKIKEAENWLLELKKIQGNKLSFVTDQILDDMGLQPPLHDIAVSYSGDAANLMQESENLGWFVPESGTNVWLDGFVIPKSSNVDLAYKFINFVSRYQYAYDNSSYVGYSSPRKDVMKVIQEEINDNLGGRTNPYIIMFNEKDEIFQYRVKLQKLIDDAWGRVRAY